MTGVGLRRIRYRMGLTQTEMAKAVGVHWNTLARWERGETPISKTASRLIKLLEKAAA